MDLSIVPEHKTCVLRGLGQRPNKHETGGFRVNGIRLFSQSGYRFALLAACRLPLVSGILSKKQGLNWLLALKIPDYILSIPGFSSSQEYILSP